MNKSKQQHFLSLYQPVHDRFERFCRARAYYDMPYEDLMNETLLVAYHKFRELKNEGAFLSFLIGISTRLLANTHRKRRTETIRDEQFLTNYADSDQQIEQQFEVELLHQALAQLPDKQREALILFELTGFSINEIMELQNSSLSAVKQRLARGRVALASIVENIQTIRLSKK